MKSLYELREERNQVEFAALQSVADAASAAADIDIKTEVGEGFMEILSKTQEDRLLADKQLELLRDAREAGKQAYEDAHLAYMALVQKRRAELLEMLFGKTADIDPTALISVSVAGEDALLNMAQIAATSGNEGLAQAVLLSAYERDLDVIHSLIRILAG